MFKELEEINSRPAPFQFYTGEEKRGQTRKRLLERRERRLYITFQKSHALRDQLSWTHYRLTIQGAGQL
jgi:hypothetical protein